MANTKVKITDSRVSHITHIQLDLTLAGATQALYCCGQTMPRKGRLTKLVV